MKTIILLFSIFLISKPALCAIGHPTSDSILLLYVAKEKRIKKYAPDNFLKIFYATDSGIIKINGKLLLVLKDSIDMLPSGKGKAIKRIAISKITSVDKLHKKGRRGWPLVIGIFAFFALAGLLYYGTWLGFLLLLFTIVPLILFVSVLILSFASDYLSRKSTAKGRKFYSGKGVNKIHHMPAISRYRLLP